MGKRGPPEPLVKKLMPKMMRIGKKKKKISQKAPGPISETICADLLRLRNSTIVYREII
jgi:hypothetical protein